jgi:membrane protease YdiL (CAAX protease family)
MPFTKELALAVGPHVALDHLLFVFIVLVSPLIDYYWFYPRLRRAVEAGVPGARSRAYFKGILGQWGVTAVVLGLWAWRGRPWWGLGLYAASPLRLGLGFALTAIVLGLLVAQRRALFARPERFELVRRQVESAVPLLPHTATERQGFRLLAITAGICEETLFRGYVFWYVSVWTGPLFGAAIGTILFGAAHLYLDRRSAVKAGIAGALMTALVFASSSLWSAMLLHAAIDLNSGDLAFRALTRKREGDATPGVPAAA